jgi:hypothetical protein
MKVLVATTETQGQRENDFCWADEGELVSFGSECDHALEALDGPCGCRRSLCGLRTGKSTTTVRVVDWPDLDRFKLASLIAEAWTRGGWGVRMTPLQLRRQANKDAKNLAIVGDYFPAGTVLERRHETFFSRERLVA